jgi:hypothetical protein
MPIWIVKATWREDETDATEQWEVNVPTAHEAVREATLHIHYPPHHVEVRHSEGPSDLLLGRSRRVIPE